MGWWSQWTHQTSQILNTSAFWRVYVIVGKWLNAPGRGRSGAILHLLLLWLLSVFWPLTFCPWSGISVLILLFFLLSLALGWLDLTSVCSLGPSWMLVWSTCEMSRLTRGQVWATACIRKEQWLKFCARRCWLRPDSSLSSMILRTLLPFLHFSFLICNLKLFQ